MKPRLTLEYFMLLLLRVLAGTLAQSPTFDDNVSYNKTFNQNVLSGAQVFDVNCTYSSNPDDLRYSIQEIMPPPSPQFLDIETETGIITLIENALSVAVSQHTIVLRCYDTSTPSNSTLETLYLSRVEENEFQPVFEETTLSYSISEVQDIMQVVFNVTATDDDLGMFGEVEYATEGAFPAEFSLDNSTGEVSLVANLDYEETQMYQFKLVAFNPAEQSSRTSVLIVIDVTDVDDEYPEFQYPDPSNQTYSITVPETYPAGGYDIPPPGFLTVNCTDPDTAPADITYAISSTDPGPFTIDQHSGALSVTREIDLDVPVLDPSSYSFTVTCQDAANHTDSALVDITISPLNEFGPSFDGAIGSIFINETHPEVGTTIAATNKDISALRYYEVTDDDVPPEIFSYFLSDAPGVEFFEIDKNTGTLTLAHSIDVDSAPSQFVLLSFQIIVCDTEFLRTDCPELTIGFFVTAANDNFPTFSQKSYDVMFDDGTPVLTELLEANCTDGDVGVGEFDRIEFASGFDTLSEAFLLDEVSGLIQNKVVLEYENVPGYGFSLICFDTAGNTANATVNITITPLNDEEPTFNTTSPMPAVSETVSVYNISLSVEPTSLSASVAETSPTTVMDSPSQAEGQLTSVTAATVMDSPSQAEGQLTSVTAATSVSVFMTEQYSEPTQPSDAQLLAGTTAIILCASVGAVALLLLIVLTLTVTCYSARLKYWKRKASNLSAQIKAVEKRKDIHSETDDDESVEQLDAVGRPVATCIVKTWDREEREYEGIPVVSLTPAAHVAEGLTLAPAAHVAEGLTLAHGTGGASLPSTEPEADEVCNLMYGTVCRQTNTNYVRESVEKEPSSTAVEEELETVNCAQNPDYEYVVTSL